MLSVAPVFEGVRIAFGRGAIGNRDSDIGLRQPKKEISWPAAVASDAKGAKFCRFDWPA